MKILVAIAFFIGAVPRYVGTGSQIVGNDLSTFYTDSVLTLYDMQGGFSIDYLSDPNHIFVIRSALSGDCTASAGSNVTSCPGIASAAAAASGAQSTANSAQSGVNAASGQTATNTSNITTLTIQVNQGPVGSTSGVGASTGFVGEFRETCVAQASAVNIGNGGTGVAVASLTLPAGDWLVSAQPSLTGALTVGLSFSAAITTGSTIPTQAAAGGADRVEQPIVSTGTSDVTVNITNRHKIFTSSTTYNLIERVSFSLGTALGYGCISALRIH